MSSPQITPLRYDSGGDGLTEDQAIRIERRLATMETRIDAISTTVESLADWKRREHDDHEERLRLLEKRTAGWRAMETDEHHRESMGLKRTDIWVGLLAAFGSALVTLGIQQVM